MSTDTLADSDPEVGGVLSKGVASINSSCVWSKSPVGIHRNETGGRPGAKSAADAELSKAPSASPSVKTKPKGGTDGGGHYGFSAVLLCKLRNATGTFLHKYLGKVHETAGHLTSSQIRKQLARVGGLPDGTWRMIDKVRGDPWNPTSRDYRGA